MDGKKPKQPPSAYLIFCNYERDNIKNTLLEKADNATVKITEIQKELSSKWKNLTDEEKNKYEEEAQVLKSKYNEDLLQWKQLQNTQAPGIITTDNLIKFPIMKIQKIMHLNNNVKKINNEAINILQKAIMLFLLELAKKTIEYKNEQNITKYLTSDDIISCIKREGIKYKFLEDCLYLLKDDNINSFLLEEEIEEPTFDLCEEDKKVYDYDVEEKKISKIKKKETKQKTTKKHVYGDITSYFKKV